MTLPFEQQAKESDKAYAAFALYLSMGPERSLEAVRKKCGKCARLIQRWSSVWQWSERVTAHATHLAVVEREATEALARGKAAEWLTRQTEVREREWRLHEKCIAAVEKALAAFMDKEKIYTNLADISRMLEVASKLGRLASGMPTDRTEVTGEDGGPIQIEFEVALRKIYSEPLPGEVLAHGQVLDVQPVEPPALAAVPEAP